MDTADCYGGSEPRRDYVQTGAGRLSYLEWGAAGSLAERAGLADLLHQRLPGTDADDAVGRKPL